MKKRNLSAIQHLVYLASQKAGFEIHEADVHTEKAKMLEHGHFATNAAMFLAGKVGGNPRDIAQKLIDNLDVSFFEKIDVAGPGFINFWMKGEFFEEECHELIDHLPNYVHDSLELKPGEKTMVSDTSHPNVAKPMGVHHLLSTIIGDSLVKLYREIGYNVISDNYIGDWGTQFGKLIYAIRTWGDMKTIEKDPIPELLKLYVKFHDESEKNEELNDFGRAEFKKLEDGDAENRKLWKYIVKVSLEEFEKIYKRLGITYDEMNGESFYEDKLEPLLEHGRKKGVFVDGEGGSWIVMPDNPDDTPALVKKSDGATLYLTRDLAQTAHWEEAHHPDLMLWVVDVAQSFHFQQRFHASRKLNQTSAEMVHANFGRMQFKDSAMSTRKGKVLQLDKVLDEAEERALKLVKEKGIDLTDAEQKDLSVIMGIGAIKYNILSQNRTTNITFDWDKMLTFEGNSAPYLMYTAARAKSILRKGDVSDTHKMKLQLTDDRETAVMLDLLMYPDALQRAAKEFKPNHIANYLYDLAQNFNTLYNALPVLKADKDEKETRLLLTSGVVAVMENGLKLLGIEVPEKM